MRPLRIVVLLVGALAGVTGLASAAGTWEQEPNLSQARRFPAAATGLDGRVYAIGALGAASGAHRTVEAFDPLTRTWSRVADMPVHAGGMGGATAPDGRVFAVGTGCSDGIGRPPCVGGAFAYSPATNTWTHESPFPIAVQESPFNDVEAVTAPDGRIYVLVEGSLLVYDPETNRWSTGAAPPTSRRGATAAVGIDGRIYLFGGTPQSSDTPLATVDVYSPRRNEWRSAAPMPTARRWPAAVSASDGLIYVLGGCCEAIGPTKLVETYDAERNRWSTGPPMLGMRQQHAAAASGRRIYAIGGHSGLSLEFVESLDTGPYDFDGFDRRHKRSHKPVRAKAGRELDVRFSLDGFHGFAVLGRGYPQSAEVSCRSHETPATGEPTRSDEPLSFRERRDEYVYEWETERAWKRTCRQFLLGLADGTVHRLNVRF